MLFSIVIPAYNCADTIHLPLASLVTQIFRDFEVIIIDDHSDEIEYAKMLAEIDLLRKHLPDLKVIRKVSNSGCGETLQMGLDACSGEYFIPIDSDDMFATAETLLHYARLIQQNKYPDAVVTSFMEYDPETGRMTLIDQNNSAFVHGKAFKVEFCRDNNVTFPSQKWFEDGAFNFIALNITKNIIRDATVTYLWQSNPKSITRSQDYNYLVMEYYIGAYIRAFPILQAKDARQANFFASGLLAYGYYYWNSFLRRRSKEDMQAFVKLLKKAFDEMKVIEAINNDRGVFDEYCRNDSRCKGMIEAQEGAFVTSLTLNDWLKTHFQKSITWLEVQNV